MATVPIAVFVRYAIMTTAAVYSNWSTISGLFERAVTDATEPIYGYYVQHIWQMKDQSSAYSDKERAMVGAHWINTTGGDLDTTWTSADFDLIEAGFATFWNAISSKISNEHQLVEHRWYAFGPDVTPPNPPFRVTTLGSPIPGVSSSVIPHQVASTVTFRTSLRRHWGRMYLPWGNGSAYASGAQIGQTDVDALATAASSYLKSGTANGLAPVVWDRNRKVALGVTAVEVDSVPDIIRRRRPRVTRYKKILTS